jgi:sortase (surface protein transpeptidase)
MKIVFKPAGQLLRARFGRVRTTLHKQQSTPVATITRLSKAPTKLWRPFVMAVRAVLLLLAFTSLSVSVFLFIPDLYYRVFSADAPPAVVNQVDQERNEPVVEEKREVLPPQDMSLPDGDWVVIPRIGVRTQLRATVDPEEALKEGVWHVPDYGHPGDNLDIPIILAAHRFGWQWWWKSDYWKYNSFYYLPDTEVGDRIEIIADHRKWVYEIYAAEEGGEITDYEADLILYTCKHLNSPVRFFRYARLIEP